MAERRRIPNVSGLEEREIGILTELRILDEANALAPVLETIAAVLEVLYLESERQAWEKAQRRHESDRDQRAGRLRALGKVSRQRSIPAQFKPDNLRIRKLIAERTAAGQWLGRLNRELRGEIGRSIVEEISRKARLAGMSRCRAYVGATQ